MAETNSSPLEAGNPVTTVATAGLGSTAAVAPADQANQLYGTGIPEPVGTEKGEINRAKEHEDTDPTAGVGVDGEVDVWVARYSMRNFIGRTVGRTILAIAWGVLAVYTWGQGHDNLAVLAYISGAVVLALWVALIFRMIQARFSHYYRLTNRRLFVSSGIFRRRRDMMELLRVKDVFCRQHSLADRWLALGTVEVVPHEKDLPVFYLTGVDDPKGVMDLVWHHARAERDQRSVKVDSI